MRLIEFWKRIDMTRLDELFIRYKTPGEHSDYHLIAHRENIWLYNSEDIDNEQLVADIQQRAGLAGENLDELSDEANERGDIITGILHTASDEFWYNGNFGSMSHNPAVSQYFKKLMMFLGVEKVTNSIFDGGDDVDIETMQHEMEGKIPDELYHGTNTTSIYNIMRIGLAPGEGEGNWKEVGQFHDIIFLTQDYYNAKFHAERQSNTLNKGAPIVLKVRVPDPAKIVPDYDMLTQMGGNTEMADELNYSAAPQYYDDHLQQQRKDIEKHNKGSDLTMISGIIGYQGRIAANHVTEIHASLGGEMMGDQDNPEYTEFNSWSEFAEALNIYDDYGYWYEGIAEEIAQQDEEEEEEDEDY